MWQRLYPFILTLAAPLVRARLKRRAQREPAYGERIKERFGAVPAEIPTGCLWFHTVSAGETIAAVPLIEQVLAAAPQHPVLVTTMTPTGSAQVTQRLGDRVHHCYAPYDFLKGVTAFYDAVAPRLLVLMETELWPNLIDQAHRRQVPALLINARLSERSAKGYARLGSLTRRMLGQLQAIACQEAAHRDRFIALGAAPEAVTVAGNLKFDHRLPEDYGAQVQRLHETLGVTGRWLWLGASTHPGEDEPLLKAQRALRANAPLALLVLVPRHPVRAPELVALAQSLELNAVLQSQHSGTLPDTVDVLVSDTMGQLGVLYGLGEAAFVGGSLIDHGGHNPIEPALCAAPVLMGPSRRNFEAVCAAFAEADALLSVEDAASLTDALQRCFDDRAYAQALGERARQVVETQGGAQARLFELIRQRLPGDPQAPTQGQAPAEDQGLGGSS
ncbi:MAG: lipid IV(A) 3-deoxy-D-manno-octulosonic acid transferase [Pseudomonadota bacterium]